MSLDKRSVDLIIKMPQSINTEMTREKLGKTTVKFSVDSELVTVIHSYSHTYGQFGLLIYLVHAGANMYL